MASKIVTISGPGGVGKDTIIERLVSIFGWNRIPAYTTRGMRPGEVEGVHYKFVSTEEYQDLSNTEYMFDELELLGNWYGTPLKEIQEQMEKNHVCCMPLSSAASFKMAELFPNCVKVLFLGRSKEQLVQRMINRGASREEAELRLQNDPINFNDIWLFDVVVVNDREIDYIAAEVAMHVLRHNGYDEG